MMRAKERLRNKDAGMGAANFFDRWNARRARRLSSGGPASLAPMSRPAGRRETGVLKAPVSVLSL